MIAGRPVAVATSRHLAAAAGARLSYGSLDTAPIISNQPSVRSCLSMTPQVDVGSVAAVGDMRITGGGRSLVRDATVAGG